MALRWREEGAQIVGGCCGVGPEHIVAAARAPRAARAPGRERPRDPPRSARTAHRRAAPAAAQGWRDRRGRPCTRCRSPTSSCEPGVAVPGAASFMAWAHLFADGIGAHQRCLDVGCGTGILAVQLALNGAAHVRALDIDDRAVANTLTNAFRNGVADRVTASTVDLYPWVPEERYEVIVASLYETPVDPFRAVDRPPARRLLGAQPARPADRQAPRALAAEGVAYIVQLSIASQQRTLERLGARASRPRVVDHTLFCFPPALAQSRAQIAPSRGAQRRLPPALGSDDVMVAYLLEVRRARR